VWTSGYETYVLRMLAAQLQSSDTYLGLPQCAPNGEHARLPVRQHVSTCRPALVVGQHLYLLAEPPPSVMVQHNICITSSSHCALTTCNVPKSDKSVHYRAVMLECWLALKVRLHNSHTLLRLTPLALMSIAQLRYIRHLMAQSKPHSRPPAARTAPRSHELDLPALHTRLRALRRRCIHALRPILNALQHVALVLEAGDRIV
jgi:hypothetical protein